MFLVDHKKLLEQLIRVKIDTSFGYSSKNVRDYTFIKASDSLQFPCLCQNLKNVVVFYIVGMCYDVLILLNSRTYCCEGVYKQNSTHFSNTSADKILLHESALWNSQFLVYFLATFKYKHLHSPTERNHYVHTQSFVKSCNSMLFLNLFHGVKNSSGLLEILLSVKEHSGFDDPHGLSDYTAKNA